LKQNIEFLFLKAMLSLSKSIFSRQSLTVLSGVVHRNVTRRCQVALLASHQLQITSFSTSRSSGRGRKSTRSRKSSDDGEDGSEGNALAVPPPSPAPLDPADAWQEVRDKNTGMIYWWNTVTNETTALGAPRPTGPTALAQPMPQQQQGGMMSGLGSVMAQGFAFGTGSAVAHNVIGNMFGGGSSGQTDSGDSGDSGDSWDI
jgi:hypothetical protein